jgi:ribosomal peptide maturation radical SAM protein 1
MGYREKSQDRFQAEVERLAERYGVRRLAVTDNILSMSYFRQFMQWAKERNLGISLFWEVKANLSRQQVKSLAEAGIQWVQPGIESFSSDVLRLMRKGVRGIQNIALLKYAQEYGLVTFYNILYGFPGEPPVEYDKMKRNVRKLVHLQPPQGLLEIEYDRFSPYHQDPASYGLRLKPKSEYRLLYPFKDEVISHLVYFFEREDAPQFPYVKRLEREVRRWQRVAQRAARKRPGLTWTLQDGEILIDDRRPGFPKRRYHLRNHAVEVFHALDRPTTMQAVASAARELPLRSSDRAPTEARDESPSTPRQPPARDPSTGGRQPWRALMRGLERSLPKTERVISFTREEFATRPALSLEPLVRTGIVYVEDDWCLALPVAARAAGDPER